MAGNLAQVSMEIGGLYIRIYELKDFIAFPKASDFVWKHSSP